MKLLSRSYCNKGLLLLPLRLSAQHVSPTTGFLPLECENGDIKPPRNRSGDSDTHNARSQVHLSLSTDANNKAWSSWHRAHTGEEREWLFRPLSLRLVTNTLVLRSFSSAACSVVSRMGAGLKRMRIREERRGDSRGVTMVTRQTYNLGGEWMSCYVPATDAA